MKCSNCIEYLSEKIKNVVLTVSDKLMESVLLLWLNISLWAETKKQAEK